MEVGTLIKSMITGEMGVVLSVKIWDAQIDPHWARCPISERYYAKDIPSIDFYVHWQSGTTSWVISENVEIVDEVTI